MSTGHSIQVTSKPRHQCRTRATVGRSSQPPRPCGQLLASFVVGRLEDPAHPLTPPPPRPARRPANAKCFALLVPCPRTAPVSGSKAGSAHASTSAEVLEKLVGEHPVVAAILEFRGVYKLKTT